jgi:hypothetical protein
MARWTAEELAELENDPEQWEPGPLVAPSPAARRGATVTLRFPRAEFHHVAYAAERAGMTLTAFIRQAAVDSAKRYPAPPDPSAEGCDGGLGS